MTNLLFSAKERVLREEATSKQVNLRWTLTDTTRKKCNHSGFPKEMCIRIHRLGIMIKAEQADLTGKDISICNTLQLVRISGTLPMQITAYKHFLVPFKAAQCLQLMR
jgi:transcription initiation factor TFIIIB Brf1 subunit/transcription initiation factor TFIIB